MNHQGTPRKQKRNAQTKIVCVFLFIAFAMKGNAQINFNRRIDIDTLEYQFGYSVLTDYDSGYVILSATLGFSPTSHQNIIFVKTDSTGIVKYHKEFNFQQPLALYTGLSGSLKKDKTGGYFFSGGSSDFITNDNNGMYTRYDSIGDTIYTHFYGGSRFDAFYNCTQTYDKGFALIGETQSYGDTLGDVWLVKLDSSGNFMWQQTYGTLAKQESGISIVELPCKDLVIGGGVFISPNNDPLLIKTDSAGNLKKYVRWNIGAKSAGGATFDLTNDGQLIYNGYYDSLLQAGDYQYAQIVGRMDTAFNFQWKSFYHYVGAIGLYKVKELPDSTIIAVGYQKESTNFAIPYGLISKLDKNGNLIWQHEYYKDSAAQNYMADVEQTWDKGFIITGMVAGNGTTNQDIWLIKLDSMGCLANNCGYTTGVIEVTEEKTEIKIYPNPVADNLHILYNIPTKEKNATLLIYDLQGRLLLQKPMDVFKHDEDVDVSLFATGMYVVKVGSEVRKFVKE